MFKIYCYLFIINFLSFIIFWIDKYLAKKKKNRIPENTLLLFSLLGGSLGSILSMLIFHHKTKKNIIQVEDVFYSINSSTDCLLLFQSILKFHSTIFFFFLLVASSDLIFFV